MMERFKNPFFILAIASLVYQILKACGVEISDEIYQLSVDIISYGLIGVGVYTTDFSKKKR